MSRGGVPGSTHINSACLVGSRLTGSPAHPCSAVKNQPSRAWPDGPRWWTTTAHRSWPDCRRMPVPGQPQRPHLRLARRVPRAGTATTPHKRHSAHALASATCCHAQGACTHPPDSRGAQAPVHPPITLEPTSGTLTVRTLTVPRSTARADGERLRCGDRVTAGRAGVQHTLRLPGAQRRPLSAPSGPQSLPQMISEAPLPWNGNRACDLLLHE